MGWYCGLSLIHIYEVKKLRMDSPESLQFLNNATKFYNLMMMYRCAIREIQTKLEVLDDELDVYKRQGSNVSAI